MKAAPRCGAFATRACLLACAAVLMAGPLAGCGDDDGGGDDAGSGLDGGGGRDGATDAPTPDRGDASAQPIRDSGTPDAPTAAECREQIVAEASDVCLDCLCDRCPAQAIDCDEACFRTVRCILESCAGDATDATCIAQRCSQDLVGAGTAMTLGLCINDCAATCIVGADTDAGSDDGGA